MFQYCHSGGSHIGSSLIGQPKQQPPKSSFPLAFCVHFRLHFAFILQREPVTKSVHLCTHLLTVCLETLLMREENQRIPLTTGTYVLKHHLNFQKNQSRPCQVLSTFCQRRFRNLRKFTKIYENLRKLTKIYENLRKFTKMFEIFLNRRWQNVQQFLR